MCQPNSHGEKWSNQTLMVRRVQQASMGQPNSHGEESNKRLWVNQTNHGEKPPTDIYGSTELSW